nr:MAG TPA: hypothetical protein [Bacteriophage sp.]
MMVLVLILVDLFLECIYHLQHLQYLLHHQLLFFVGLYVV